MGYVNVVPYPTQEEVDAVLRTDFVAFVGKTFRTLNPGRELKRNWHHEAIAHALSEVMEGRCRRLIINIPPRYMKSIMASVAFPAYVLGHNPTKRVICASYAQDLAAKLSRDCRTIMEAPWYRRLFPAAALDPSHKAECDFATLKRGSRFATSVGGVLTGLGGDIVIIDDPLKPTDAMSEKARQGAIEWFNNTVSSRLDDKNSGAIIVIMQRLHLEDLSGHLLRAGGWKVLDIPAIAPEAKTYQIGLSRHYARPEGEVLHAAYESQEALRQLKRTMGNLSFEAQYQQNPVPAEGAQIRREWLRFYDNKPKMVLGGAKYQSWDTASTAKELSDWSVCTTWYVEEGKFYLLDVHRRRLSYPDLKKAIINHSRQWNCSTVIIEEKGAGQHLIQEFDVMGIRGIIPFMPKADKVMRLAAVSPLIEGGRVLLPRSAPWYDDFLTELLQFPNGPHDDQVDSFSQFLNYWQDRNYNTIRVVQF
jgi:predicted phage terminase large subunit-like protein